jgi:hypothetical protein
LLSRLDDEGRFEAVRLGERFGPGSCLFANPAQRIARLHDIAATCRTGCIGFDRAHFPDGLFIEQRLHFGIDPLIAADRYIVHNHRLRHRWTPRRNAPGKHCDEYQPPSLFHPGTIRVSPRI